MLFEELVLCLGKLLKDRELLLEAVKCAFVEKILAIEDHKRYQLRKLAELS